MDDLMQTVESKRLQYTPSAFARSSLLHLQETGTLTALRPHTSARRNLGGYLLLVVEKGKGSVSVGNRTYELHPGDAAFIDCSKPYSHSTQSDLWSIAWVHFNGPSMTAIYGKFLQRSGGPVFHAASDFTTLLGELYSAASGSSYVRDMRINSLLSLLMERVMEVCWNEESEEAARGNTIINLGEVKKYIDLHYMEKVTLERLSSLFFVERTYLSRAFKKLYGVNMIDYLSIARVNKVKELLRFGIDGRDVKLAEIAELTGFSSEQHLSSRFKKIEGCTPSDYRQRWK